MGFVLVLNLFGELKRAYALFFYAVSNLFEPFNTIPFIF